MKPEQLSISTNRFHTRAAELGFTPSFNTSCEALTGQLLSTLVASKPGGQVLKLGTGVGMGSAYLD